MNCQAESILPVGCVYLHVGYTKIVPLEVTGCVQVWSKVKFIEISCNPKYFGQVP